MLDSSIYSCFLAFHDKNHSFFCCFFNELMKNPPVKTMFYSVFLRELIKIQVHGYSE